ncbi:hypothetical protein CYY_005809 [Polysphondylium violaceum]|uniref:PPM-type phosphatase domain-containing protein n=1 Tax=Polysphondylium violaceum TaxID=133409 RepID=A0A8J4UYJ2_9MYCE|nr:hypothetical protein CYY_005809 [Polysphondylium violaceum]
MSIRVSSVGDIFQKVTPLTSSQSTGTLEASLKKSNNIPISQQPSTSCHNLGSAMADQPTSTQNPAPSSATTAAVVVVEDVNWEKKYYALLEENIRLKHEIYEYKLKYEPHLTNQSPRSDVSTSSSLEFSSSPKNLHYYNYSTSPSNGNGINHNPTAISSSLSLSSSSLNGSGTAAGNNNNHNHSLKDSSIDDKKKKQKKWKPNHLIKFLDKKTKKDGGLDSSQQGLRTSAEDSEFAIDEKKLSTPYTNLPKLEVIPVSPNGKEAYFTGPDYPNERTEPVKETGTPMVSYPTAFSDSLYAVSTSTYPFIPGTMVRAGDPIADRYTCCVYNNRLITCLADGCNWGQKPKEAAQKASTAFIEYVVSKNDLMTNVKEVGKILFEGFECAHKSIMVGKDEFWEAGTTTLLGGVLLQINKGNDKWSPQWEFVCASVGDCKAFYINQGEITDITEGNRSNLDAKDCGGRLGPHLEQGKPDLRNLNIFCAPVYDDDIIVIVTDGVHDNLDPRHLGKSPHEMSKEFNISGDKWSDIDLSKAITAKNAFTATLLSEIIQDSTSPKEIANKLIQHCWDTTVSSRHFMETNNGKRLPEDYGKYPGKMDHTTVICFKAGQFKSSSTLNINSNSTTPSLSITSASTSNLHQNNNNTTTTTTTSSSSNPTNGGISPSDSIRISNRDWIKTSPSHNKFGKSKSNLSTSPSSTSSSSFDTTTTTSTSITTTSSDLSSPSFSSTSSSPSLTATSGSPGDLSPDNQSPRA